MSEKLVYTKIGEGEKYSFGEFTLERIPAYLGNQIFELNKFGTSKKGIFGSGVFDTRVLSKSEYKKAVRLLTQAKITELPLFINHPIFSPIAKWRLENE